VRGPNQTGNARRRRVQAAQRGWEASASAIRRPVGRAEDGRTQTAWRVTSCSHVHSALIGAIRERSNWVPFTERVLVIGRNKKGELRIAISGYPDEPASKDYARHTAKRFSPYEY
jgi:hypothetical protein